MIPQLIFSTLLCFLRHLLEIYKTYIKHIQVCESYRPAVLNIPDPVTL